MEASRRFGWFPATTYDVSTYMLSTLVGVFSGLTIQHMRHDTERRKFKNKARAKLRIEEINDRIRFLKADIRLTEEKFQNKKLELDTIKAIDERHQELKEAAFKEIDQFVQILNHPGRIEIERAEELLELLHNIDKDQWGYYFELKKVCKELKEVYSDCDQKAQIQLDRMVKAVSALVHKDKEYWKQIKIKMKLSGPFDDHTIH